MLTILLLAGLSVCALGPKLFDRLAPQDEGILLVYPDLILRGSTPYHDFVALYPPGIFYLIGGAFYLFGSNIFVERSVGIGSQFLMAAAVYLLGSRITWLTGFLSAVVVLVVLRLFPAAGANSMFGALALLLFALLCGTRSCEVTEITRQKQFAMLAGMLTGAIYWFRQDIGVIGTLGVVVALDPRRLRRLRFFVIGFTLPAAAMVAFAVHAGPLEVFDSLVLDVIRTGPGRRLPIQIGGRLIGLAVCVLINVVLALLPTGDSEHSAWLRRAVAVVSVGLLPSALQRADAWHILYVGSAVAGLTVVSVSGFFMRMDWHPRISTRHTALLVSAVVAAFGVAFIRNAGSHRRQTFRVGSGDRWIFTNSRGVLADATGLLEEIKRAALPDDKLFVGPRDLRFSNSNDTYFYYLLPHLRPATRYLEMNPGSANRSDSGLADEIASADWLILTSRFEDWNEPNASMVPGSPLPNEVVRRHFCVHSEHGIWQLLRRCEPRPSL